MPSTQNQTASFSKIANFAAARKQKNWTIKKFFQRLQQMTYIILEQTRQLNFNSTTKWVYKLVRTDYPINDTQRNEYIQVSPYSEVSSSFQYYRKLKLCGLLHRKPTEHILHIKLYVAVTRSDTRWLGHSCTTSVTNTKPTQTTRGIFKWIAPVARGIA
jgi:hypothetical protein